MNKGDLFASQYIQHNPNKATSNSQQQLQATKKHVITFPAMSNDDKNAKFEAQQQESAHVTRRVIFYALFSTLLLDAYVSHADVLNHLTLWSWIVHTLYFELHVPSSPGLTRALHGPSFTGAHALFAMYVWVLIANPTMEFDLAPEGRADWVVYARAAFMHAAPVVFHWIDLSQNKSALCAAYKGYDSSKLFQFWAMIGGYFAMGLTWEQFNGDASGTYNVTIVSPEAFSAISKVTGVLACLASYFVLAKPVLFKETKAEI